MVRGGGGNVYCRVWLGVVIEGIGEVRKVRIRGMTQQSKREMEIRRS